MKKYRVGVAFVGAPSPSWVYTQLKRRGDLKLRVPAKIGTDRWLSSTTGILGAWFSDIEKRASPKRCVTETF